MRKAPPNVSGIAQSIVGSLEVGEIRDLLDQGLHQGRSRTYTIFLADSITGDLSLFFGGPTTTNAVLDPETHQRLRAVHAAADQHFQAVPGSFPLSPAGPLVQAAAALTFREEKYGLFLLHGPDGIDPSPWQHVVNVLGPELVKAQLYESASHEVGIQRSKLDALREAGELLKYVDLEVLLTKLMETSVGIMGAQVGAIVLADEHGFRTGVEWGLSEEILLELKTPAGGSFLQATLERGEALLVEDVSTSDQIDAGELAGRIQSLLAIPLATQSKKLGVIVIVNSGADGLKQADSEVLSTIANLSASAVESALLYEQALVHERISAEMDLASRVQSSLLPSSAPDVAGIELAGWNLTCTETGGDYYDFIDMGEGKTAVVVGDGTGHGMGAALMMFITRSTLRALLTQTRDLVEVLETMNDLIEASSASNRFMTLFIGVIDPATKRMICASAGHDPPILYRASGETAEFGGAGVPLGVLPGSRYSTHEVELEDGDFWVIGTDGIWEARNPLGEFYGKERLHQIVTASRHLELEEASRAIREDIVKFHDGAAQMDDITAVLMRVL